MSTAAPITMGEFFFVLHQRVETVIAGAEFDPSQRDLLRQTVAKANAISSGNPLADPLIVFYLVCHANGREVDEQGQELAQFLHLYLLSLGLFDDVQDDDLAGTPYAEVGPAIALNTALALLFLAMDALRRAMTLERDDHRRLEYLNLLNKTSLLAVAGQHLDLLGDRGATTPAEVLEMQRHKTSTPSLLFQTAAVFAGCSESNRAHYRAIGENFALLVQLVDDVRDVYGKQVSPDLATGKMTYPLACFLELAAPAERERFERLKSELPASMRSIRQLLHGAGALKRVANTVEGFRRSIHRTLAATGNFSAAHRTLLFIVDGLAQMLYRVPRLAETRVLFEPQTPWHQCVRSAAHEVLGSLKAYGSPPVPPLLPWHLPHWMYHPESGVVYYPDIEGQPEETLRFQALLMGKTDLGRVQEVAEAQAPVVVAHELFHYWRDATGNLSNHMWHEEYVANSLALSYASVFQPEALGRVCRLTCEVLSLDHNQLTPAAQAVLDDLFASEALGSQVPFSSQMTSEQIGEYGLDLHQMALVQLAMVQRLAQAPRDLGVSVRQYLRSAGTQAA